MLKIKKMDGHWHVDGVYLGERVRRSTGLRATKALRPLAEALRVKAEREITGSIAGPKVSRETFRDAYLAYRSWLKIEKRWTKRQENKLVMMCDFWGDVPLKDITNEAVTAYIMVHWAHIIPSTIRRYLNDFIAVLSYADSRLDNYTKPKIKRPFVDDGRTAHLDANEANELLDWMAKNYPQYLPHFTTLIDTGVRLGEMLNLNKRNFRDESELVVTKKNNAKTKTITRSIPYTVEMREIRDRFMGQNHDGPLYPAALGEAWRNANSASATLNKVLTKGIKAIGVDDDDEGFRVHDLRHTFAYLTAKAGADLGDLQLLMGHADISMTMRYRGFILSRARTYVSNLRVAS
tara:strand:+ start:52 stop:1098 length:1047 start_codon:yes stop_codon:yes gene_type:complete